MGTDPMAFQDEVGVNRRRNRRRIRMGVLGFMLVVVTLVGWGFESFQEGERYSTADAREAMNNQTTSEVEYFRLDFDNRHELPSTVPQPITEREDITEVRAPTDGSGDDSRLGEENTPGTGEHSSPSYAPVPEAPTVQSERKSRQNAELTPSEFAGRLAGPTSQTLVPDLAEEDAEPFSNPYVSSPMLPDEMFDTVLLIGADAGGKLADSIILVLFPEDGSSPALLSIPRDLYLPNPCTQDYRRVNANLWGCGGGVSGPELLGVVIEDFTGVAVDHYVRIDFEGFTEVVDGFGGVEICFDHPTLDQKAQLDIAESGCRMADGHTALAFARSRNARQLVDGEWRSAWSSDTIRQKHQRELLLQMAGRLRDSSLIDLVSSFQTLSHTFRLDSGWSIAEAVGLAWRYHDLDLSLVTQLRVAVDGYQTPLGELVGVPKRLFNEILSEWWAPAAS